MSKTVLRVRIVSFNDAENRPFPNIILYLKKLTQVSTSESSIKLQEDTCEPKTVLSFNETFDVLSDNEYYQILFIEATTTTRVITDFVFWSKHLFDLINESKHKKSNQTELLCNAPLEQNYILKFSLRLIENIVHVNKMNCKKAKHQPVRGHLMAIKQFNEPVHCAICRKFIWGVRYQGYECSLCSLVTHRRCHKRIPFWCQKSPNLGPCFETGNRRFEFHLPHVFKHYQLPFVLSLFFGDHRYCNHCGSQVVQNALKCTMCSFIVHELCDVNVPPMCGISYKVVAKAIEKGLYQIRENDSPINSTEKESNTYSDTSSINFEWLGPLPKADLRLLPKLADFEFIGRLGNGHYGNVYCVQHIPSKECVAIKVVNGLIEEAKQQIEIEKQILFRYSQQNPFMIKPYCSFHQGSNLFLVMDVVDGDSLHQKIHKTRMNEDEIRFYLAEIVSVLQYLHSNNIVYRDLKLEHVVVTSEGHIRLVDYGLVRLLKTSNELCYTVCGTRGYMAPEVCCLEDGSSEDGYSYPVDYWALGIIFVQMLCGEQLEFHPEYNSEATYSSNPNDYIKLCRNISSEAQSCLSGLLEIDPKKRLGSPNSPHGPIREHPFFNAGREIDWEVIDEGIFKSMHKRRTLIGSISDISIDSFFPTLSLDRGACAKSDWVTAGESICAPNDEEQFISFDYVTESSWRKLNQ